MKELDVVRLKRTVWSNGTAIPVGTTATIVAVRGDESPATFEAEVVESEGRGKTVLTVLAEDLMFKSEAELFQNNPLSLVTITPVERLNDDVRCQIHALVQSPNGGNFTASTSGWVLGDDIRKFLKDVKELKEKPLTRASATVPGGKPPLTEATITASSPEEFTLSIHQRHASPIVRFELGKQRFIQNQTHTDMLSGSFELDTTYDAIVAGFEKLLEYGK